MQQATNTISYINNITYEIDQIQSIAMDYIQPALYDLQILT